MTLCVQNPIILHNNARSHTAAAVTNLLRHWQWKILEYPVYSPDMNPCNYNLFAKVKKPRKWPSTTLLVLDKDGHTDGVQHLPNIWQKVINNGGSYIEGT